MDLAGGVASAGADDQNIVGKAGHVLLQRLTEGCVPHGDFYRPKGIKIDTAFTFGSTASRYSPASHRRRKSSPEMPSSVRALSSRIFRPSSGVASRTSLWSVVILVAMSGRPSLSGPVQAFAPTKLTSNDHGTGGSLHSGLVADRGAPLLHAAPEPGSDTERLGVVGARLGEPTRSRAAAVHSQAQQSGHRISFRGGCAAAGFQPGNPDGEPSARPPRGSVTVQVEGQGKRRGELTISRYV